MARPRTGPHHPRPKVEPAGQSVPLRLDQMPDVLLVRDVAVVLRVSDRQIRKMVALGELPHFRIGVEIRFYNRALSDWIAQGTARKGKTA